MEAFLSSGSHAVIPLIPAPLRYFKTLQVVRERTCIALHDYARDINWRRPVLFVQILKVARGYLRDVVGRPAMTREEFKQEFTGRLGVATVLIGRFESIDQKDAEEAIGALRLSLEQGNSAETAVPYLLEAATLLFDAGGTASDLKSIMEYARECLGQHGFESIPAAQLAGCDNYLRIASAAIGKDRTSALASARVCVDHAVKRARYGDDRVASRLMSALVREVERDPALLNDHAIVGLRLPFGIRTLAETPSVVLQFTPELVRAIAPLAASGEPLARGVCADLLELSKSKVADSTALRRIVEYRSGDTRHDALTDERSRLLSLRDKLELASAESDKRQRSAVVTELILMSIAAPASPSPILVIAQDVEMNGPVDLQSKTARSGSAVARAAVTGDGQELLRIAASRAVNCPDLGVAPLGGRSGVTTVGDYYGLVSETFVFKELPAIVLEREQPRVAALTAAIGAAGRGSDYLVCSYLDSIPLDGGTVRSVRRFVSGSPVSLVALGADLDQRVDLLSRTAEFLGFMNTVEEATADGVRRDLKAKEVGRWIRAVGVDEPTGHFDEWWLLVSHAAVARRRDAHLDNWVVAADGRLLALDLEAVGCRPVGYELAQITDDRVLLEPADWVARRAIFDRYRTARGNSVGAEGAEWLSYEASLAARAVGKLTWSEATPEEQEHARSLLEEIAISGSAEGLRKWVLTTLDAWRRHRGLADLTSGELNMDHHHRRRVSKAMAYHLRHSDVLNVDHDGWASLPELARAIGRGVTETEVAIVASTLSEPRFEFRDNLVRARYGHTRHVPMILRPADKASELRAYHATTLESALYVIERGEGLKPIKRQFVHLSTDRCEALRAGVRHGAPLLLSANRSQVPGAMVASGRTLVAPEIASANLRVEPISTHWELVPHMKRTNGNQPHS
ncbi:hypothetical protein BH11ACT8_BH11ACT8_02410 [soil metagenome]